MIRYSLVLLSNIILSNDLSLIKEYTHKIITPAPAIINNKQTDCEHQPYQRKCLVSSYTNEDTSRNNTRLLREVLLKNNTVFTQEEINAIAAPYLNQPLESELILELLDRLIQAYIDRGYFTSFVVLEGQETSTGTVIYNAVEGTATIEVTGRGIRDEYIKSRLKPFLTPPLQQKRLEEGLSLLLIDPLVKNLRSTITPGDRSSESILNINFTARPRWNIGAEISNDEIFTVGSWGIRGFIENNNVAGGGEQFRAEYKVTEGLDRWLIGATIPILPTQSRLELTYQQSDSRIIDGFFKDFDIKNNSYVASARFTQPIWRKLNESLDFSFGVDHQESQSFVENDELFSNVRLTAIRLDQTYVKRFQIDPRSGTAKSLAIIVSQFSIGLSNQEIDSTFFHWQGQGQYLYNFGIGQIFTRLALQLTPHSLPTIEQCAIGGRNGNQFIFGNTVRGYTTNARTGDSCVASTIEVRFPIIKTTDFEFSGFPFFDVGYVWNSRGQSITPQILIGTGVGVRLSYRDLLLIQTNYGFALNDTNSGFDDLTQGLSFSVLGQFRF